MAIGRNAGVQRQKNNSRDVVDLSDELNESYEINETSMTDNKKRKVFYNNNNIMYNNNSQCSGEEGDQRLLEGMIRGMLAMESCFGPKGIVDCLILVV